jgi:steroid 5-alpha reductase family enzyme
MATSVQTQDATCDVLQLAWEGLVKTDGNHPIRQSVVLCVFVSVSTFVVSTATDNYSQVDKIWSIIPCIYTWLFVLVDGYSSTSSLSERNLLMAVLATVWGLRLTWNFNRRGGYKWPPWYGDEDYRWKLVRGGELTPILTNQIVWIMFNLIFTSFYQNILLLWMISPVMVVHIVASTPSRCPNSPLNIFDLVATILFLSCVAIEGIADNQQYEFQIKKYKLRHEGAPLQGEYKDGFCQSGLFSVVRKPNYAAEQSTWISFYLFSVAAFTGDRWLNWSITGFIMLCLLFQGSGWLTEKITCSKYPKYYDYMKKVPRYVPNPFQGSKEKKES